jgi:hypothetical protein
MRNSLRLVLFCVLSGYLSDLDAYELQKYRDELEPANFEVANRKRSLPCVDFSEVECENLGCNESEAEAGGRMVIFVFPAKRKQRAISLFLRARLLRPRSL